MGYSGGSLASLGATEPMVRAAERTTRRVGELLQERVKHHTPVAKPPPGAEAEWQAARKRIPGTLKESWHVGRVRVLEGGRLHEVDVYSDDPIAPHVEYPTRPHIIMPRRPGGWLRFWDRLGRTVFARLVHHPGTGGSYMMATALAEVAIEWEQIGAEEMAVWASEQRAVIR